MRIGRGTIYKRANGSFECKWWMAGKQKSKAGFKHKYEAQQYLAGQLFEKGKAGPLGADDGRKQLGDWMDAVVAEKESEGCSTTNEMKLRIKNHILPYFGDNTKLAAISYARVVEFRNYLQKEKHLSNSTINHCLSHLRQAFKIAIKSRHISSAPPIERLPDNSPPYAKFLPEEAETVLRNLPEHFAAFFMFQAEVGWRISECLTLDWSMVREEEELIVLPPHSTKEDDEYERIHPFTENIRAIMIRRRSERIGREHNKLPAYVFTDPEGRRIFDYCYGNARARKEVYKAWRAACEKAGAAGKHPHGLRGSAAVMRRNAGIPDDLNMALGGWKTRKMLDRYLGKKRTEDLRNAVAKLDRLKLNRRRTVAE